MIRLCLYTSSHSLYSVHVLIPLNMIDTTHHFHTLVALAIHYHDLTHSLNHVHSLSRRVKSSVFLFAFHLIAHVSSHSNRLRTVRGLCRLYTYAPNKSFQQFQRPVLGPFIEIPSCGRSSETTRPRLDLFTTNQTVPSLVCGLHFDTLLALLVLGFCISSALRSEPSVTTVAIVIPSGSKGSVGTDTEMDGIISSVTG
jgi:hypothetical protein